MEFLIYDYTDCEDDPRIRVVDAKELFDILDKARKDDEVKIAVYAIGECLLDWS